MSALAVGARLNRGLPQWMWLVPLLLALTWAASQKLNLSLFWIDEQLTRHMAVIDATQGPIPFSLIASRVSGDTWPPLYYFILALWARLAGTSDFALRVMSFFPGVLTVALMYRLGGALLSRRAGLVAALLLSASAFFIHYLYEARAYSLYTFFTVLCVWLYWRLLRHPQANNFITRLIFMGSMVALLYLHYIAPITCIALGLYHLLFAPRNVRWWVLARQFVYAAVAFIPWAGIAIGSASSEGEAARGLSTTGIIQMTLWDFSNFAPVFLMGVLGFSLLLIRRRAVFFLWWWVALAFVLAILLNTVLQFLFSARHIMMLLLAFCLLMALSITHLSGRWRLLGAALVGVWVLLGVWAYAEPRYFGDTPAGVLRREWAVAESLLRQCVGPQDAVVFHFDVSLDGSYRPLPERQYARNEWRHEIPMRPYYLGTGTQAPYAQLFRMQDLRHSEHVFDEVSDPPYEERMAQFLGAAPQVWLMASPGMPDYAHRAEFEAYVRARYAYCERVVDGPDLVVDLYSQQPALGCAAPPITQGALAPCQASP